MNFYNPYYIPYAMPATKSLFSGLLGKGITFSSILSGTQKTLNIVNQAIPVVKQVSPMFKNAKTMLRVMNEFKRVDDPVSKKVVNNVVEAVTSNDAPTFFQ